MKGIRTTFALVFLLPALSAAANGQTAGKAVITPSAPAPVAEAVPAPGAGGPVDSNTYVIGADDALTVTVWQEAQLSGPVTVRPDGKISLPLIHDIQAAGLTPTQLSNNIGQGLAKFLTDPTVEVTVTAVKSKYIYMVGEIGHVGPISIAPGMTILQAIASAGGLSPYANKKRIYILRGDPAHQQQIHFDYKKAMKGDMQGITLEPGDTIVVPS